MFPLGVAAQTTGAWTRILALNFDGANGSTTFTDLTGRHTVAAVGSAAITGNQLSVNQDGYALTDSGADHADFNFSASDFRISCDVTASSIGNDYLWMKSSGGAFGICLRLLDAGGGNCHLVVCDKNAVGFLSTTLPTIVGAQHHLEVSRIADNWTMKLDGAVVATAVTSEGTTSTSGSGYNGIQIAGGSGGPRLSAYVDNVDVWKR